MKVLMLTSSYPIEGSNLGPFVQNIARALQKQGVEVTVMIFSVKGKFKRYKGKSGVEIIEYPYSGFLPPALHRNNGLIPTVKNSLLAKLEFPMYLSATSRYLKKLSKEFDIIHAHWYIPAGYIAAKAKKHTRKPLITTAWGAEFHLPKNTIVKKILNYVNKKSDIKVAVSKYMKSKAREYGLNIQNMKVIPNGVDVNQFSLKRKKTNKIIIASVRRLVPEKRIQDLIKAVAALPDELKSKISLWIIGDGPEKSKLIQLTKNLKLNKITKFWGTVLHKEISKILSQIDIYVNPSIQEGMATANIEAMAAGCCVIATKGVGNDEVIIHGKNGYLYSPKNTQELSNMLKRYINKYPKQVGLNARKHSKKNFSMDKIAEMYIKAYKELS